MIIGKTESGFEFEIPEENLDDWELIETLADIDAGNAEAIVKIPKMLLGAEQANDLKEHLRGNNGRISATAMTKVITEILKSTKKLKNS